MDERQSGEMEPQNTEDEIVLEGLSSSPTPRRQRPSITGTLSSLTMRFGRRASEPNSAGVVPAVDPDAHRTVDPPASSNAGSPFIRLFTVGSSPDRTESPQWIMTFDIADQPSSTVRLEKCDTRSIIHTDEVMGVIHFPVVELSNVKETEWLNMNAAVQKTTLASIVGGLELDTFLIVVGKSIKQTDRAKTILHEMGYSEAMNGAQIREVRRAAKVLTPVIDDLDALREQAKMPDCVWLDVRSKWDIERDGTIPGDSVNVPVTIADVSELRLRARERIPDTETPVIVFSNSGRRSKVAKNALQELGYSTVLNGGGLKAVRELASFDAHFDPMVDPFDLVEQRATDDPRTVWLDVRDDAEREEFGALVCEHLHIAVTFNDQSRLKDTIHTFVHDLSTPIVTLCQTGRKARVAKQVLLGMGYEVVLNGGAYSDVSEVANMHGSYDTMVDARVDVEAQAKLKGCVWIDTRTLTEIAEHGGLMAEFIHLPSTLSDQSHLRDTAHTHIPDTGVPVITFCTTGRVARRAKELLKELGYVSVLNGGTFEEIKELANETAPYDPRIDAREDVEAQAKLKGCVWVDCRSSNEIERDGGLLAQYVHMPVTLPDQSAVRDGARDKIPDLGTPVITFCLSGRRARKAKEALHALGYTTVLNGGTFKEIKDLANMSAPYDPKIDSREEIEAMARMPGCVWMDNRSEQEILRDGGLEVEHVHISISLADQTHLIDTAHTYIPSLDTPVIAFCKSGRRGRKAKEALLRMGYKNVLNGGVFPEIVDLASETAPYDPMVDELEDICAQAAFENVVWLDCRSNEEIERDGGLKRSTVHLPITLSSQKRLKDAIHTHVPDTTTPVVTFCTSGRRSRKAKEVLQESGYVSVLNGGSFENIKALADVEKA